MKSFFTNLKQRYNIRDYKISLVFLVTLISLVGILMVRSARPDLMNRQIMGVCLGLIVMFIISFIDYKWILNLYWPLYALNIVMLLAVLVFGTKVNGARRWLRLPAGQQLQPAEVAKIAVILFIPVLLCHQKDGNEIEKFRTLNIPVIINLRYNIQHSQSNHTEDQLTFKIEHTVLTVNQRTVRTGTIEHHQPKTDQEH